MPDGPLGPPPGAPSPAPVPTGFTLNQVQGSDGKVLVLMVVTTPAGSGTYFLDPEAAKALGGRLVNLGSAGRVILAGAVNGSGHASKP